MKKVGFSLLPMALLLSGCLVSLKTNYPLISSPEEIPGLAGTYYQAKEGAVIKYDLTSVSTGVYTIEGDTYTTSKLKDNLFIVQSYNAKYTEYECYLLKLADGTLSSYDFEDKPTEDAFYAKVSAIQRHKQPGVEVSPDFQEAQLNLFKEAILQNWSLFKEDEPLLTTKEAAEREAQTQKTQGDLPLK